MPGCPHRRTGRDSRKIGVRRQQDRLGTQNNGHIGSAGTQLGRFDHHSLDKIGQGRRALLNALGNPRRWVVQMLLKNLFDFFARVRRPAGQGIVQGRPQTVNIDGRGNRLVANHLRRHVQRRSD